MPDQFRVVCGACRVNPDIVAGDAGDEEAVCPLCGQRDKAEDALAVAQEHLQFEAQVAFQTSVGDAVKHREFIRFTPEPLTPREFRWRVAKI